MEMLLVENPELRWPLWDVFQGRNQSKKERTGSTELSKIENQVEELVFLHIVEQIPDKDEVEVGIPTVRQEIVIDYIIGKTVFG